MSFYKIRQARSWSSTTSSTCAGQGEGQAGRGNAGHNGLRSIDAMIGPDYWRIRIGIGHPG